jgi:hypothetical protein
VKSLFTGQAGDCDTLFPFRNPIADAIGCFGGIAMQMLVAIKEGPRDGSTVVPNGDSGEAER